MKTIVTQPVDSITNQQKGSHLRNGYRGLSALEEIMIFLTVNIPASLNSSEWETCHSDSDI